MKKTLLLFCAIPCLVSAQTSIQRELKDKLFNGLLVKEQRCENRLLQRSGSSDNLPDTIYIYKGAEKQLIYIDAITYDEEGRKKLVSESVDNNANGIIDESDDQYKSEFTYTQAGDSIAEECVIYEFKEDEWLIFTKEVFIQNKINMYTGYYRYTYLENSWFLLSQTVATEINEKGLPIVMNSMYFDPSVPGKSDLLLMEKLYNKNDLDSILTFSTIVEKGILKDTISEEKAAYTYDANNRLSKYVHSFYDKEEQSWDYGFTIEYTYDEKGNLASEIETSEYGIEKEIYYKNIYLSSVSNISVLPIESVVYPNPVSDVLNVTINGADEAVITLVSANGSIVTQQKVQQSTVTIPVSSFAKGYYFLTVQTEQGITTHKVMIK